MDGINSIHYLLKSRVDLVKRKIIISKWPLNNHQPGSLSDLFQIFCFNTRIEGHKQNIWSFKINSRACEKKKKSLNGLSIFIHLTVIDFLFYISALTQLLKGINSIHNQMKSLWDCDKKKKSLNGLKIFSHIAVTDLYFYIFCFNMRFEGYKQNIWSFKITSRPCEKKKNSL